MVKIRTRRSPLHTIIGIVIFLVLLGVSGYALAATGNFRNPFTAVTQMLGSGTGRAFNGEAPNGDNANRPARQAPSGDVQARGEGGSQTSITWSEAGGMLFNLWFFAAASAAVMLVHYPFNFVTRRLRSTFRAAAPLST